MISDCVSLSDKDTRFDRALVAEDGAVDAGLPLSGSCVDAVIFEVTPDKECIGLPRAQDDLFARPAEEARAPPVAVELPRVVPVKEGSSDVVTVFCDPPFWCVGLHSFRSVLAALPDIIGRPALARSRFAK